MPDAGRAQDPRRRLLAGREPGRRTGRARRSSISARMDAQAVSPSMPIAASPAPASARTACSTSTSGTRSTPSGRCPSCSRRPSTRTQLFIGWAGQDWAAGRAAARLGVRGRCPDRQAELDSSTPCRPISTRKTGTSNVWSIDVGRREEQPAVPAGQFAEPRLLTAATARRRCRSSTSVTALNPDTGAGGLELPDRPSRHLGLRHQFRAGAVRHAARTARPSPR